MSYQAKRSDEEKQHNDQSNANAVRTAAAVASASGHPVATAVGKGVQLGDKLTDGKISEVLGKGLSKANNLMPGGKYSQECINKCYTEVYENKDKTSSNIEESKIEQTNPEF